MESNVKSETAALACAKLGVGGPGDCDSLTVDELRASHHRLKAREAEMMKLLGTSKPENLVHDLRNVLNEVALLKAAAKLGD